MPGFDGFEGRRHEDKIMTVVGPVVDIVGLYLDHVLCPGQQVGQLNRPAPGVVIVVAVVVVEVVEGRGRGVGYHPVGVVVHRLVLYSTKIIN